MVPRSEQGSRQANTPSALETKWYGQYCDWVWCLVIPLDRSSATGHTPWYCFSGPRIIRAHPSIQIGPDLHARTSNTTRMRLKIDLVEETWRLLDGKLVTDCDDGMHITKILRASWLHVQSRFPALQAKGQWPRSPLFLGRAIAIESIIKKFASSWTAYSTLFDLIKTLTWLSLSANKVKKPSSITSLSSTFFVIIFSGFILPELIAWRTSSKSPRTYVATPCQRVSQSNDMSMKSHQPCKFSRGKRID